MWQKRAWRVWLHAGPAWNLSHWHRLSTQEPAEAHMAPLTSGQKPLILKTAVPGSLRREPPTLSVEMVVVPRTTLHIIVNLLRMASSWPLKMRPRSFSSLAGPVLKSVNSLRLASCDSLGTGWTLMAEPLCVPSPLPSSRYSPVATTRMYTVSP